MRHVAWLFLLAGALGCSTNPYTGRQQLLLVDEGTERELGVASYQKILGESRLSADPAEVEPVRRVGRRIADAAAKPEFQWEFNVIVDDKTMNAWCLPGGKIAFYTGIYPALQDEAGMAFVMGHEVSHALLHHGAERMSQGQLAEGAGALLGAVLGSKDSTTQQGILAAFGAATNVGILLPFSRKHETEADRIGLELMAKAGYDPRASVEVWKRMASKGGDEPPQWLSTHPSHESRIQDLESRMAAALAIYEKAPRAPNAKLPPVSNRPGKGGQAGAAFAAGGGGVKVSAAAVRTESRESRVQVSFDRDVFVRRVDIQGPGGAKKERAIDSAVPAGAKRWLALSPGDADAAGSYTLTFHGSESGRPFSAAATVTLP